MHTILLIIAILETFQWASPTCSYLLIAHTSLLIQTVPTNHPDHLNHFPLLLGVSQTLSVAQVCHFCSCDVPPFWCEWPLKVPWCSYQHQDTLSRKSPCCAPTWLTRMINKILGICLYYQLTHCSYSLKTRFLWLRLLPVNSRIAPLYHSSSQSFSATFVTGSIFSHCSIALNHAPCLQPRSEM